MIKDKKEEKTSALIYVRLFCILVTGYRKLYYTITTLLREF